MAKKKAEIEEQGVIAEKKLTEDAGETFGSCNKCERYAARQLHERDENYAQWLCQDCAPFRRPK